MQASDIFYEISLKIIAIPVVSEINHNEQVTWLAVAKWISENWNIDRCLSFLADRIYYGHGYYGLKEAATGYFDKEPKDLSIEEISMLIATTTSPSYYDLRNKDEKLLNKSDEIKEMTLKSKSWR